VRDTIYNDVQIVIPPDWKDASTIVLVGPAREDFTPNVTISRDSLHETQTPEQYAQSQLSDLQEEFRSSGYHIMHEGPINLKVGPAYQRRHTFTLPNTDLTVQQLQTYVVNDGAAFTITATDRTEYFEQTQPLFTQFIKEFTFV